MSAVVVPETEVPTLEAIDAAMDAAWQRFEARLARLDPNLPTKPDAGGWTARQLLSHLVGAWQRVPLHAASFLAGESDALVPIEVHDPYWTPEWETAPLAAFLLTARAAYEGTRLVLRDLNPAALATRRPTVFGEMSLGDFLIVSFAGHIDRFHGAQLEAFARAEGAGAS